ncbi:MAG: arylesterase [Gammaproteobacteria bacterium]|nr:arylesterase [Gammaproteobacteria bacterium]
MHHGIRPADFKMVSSLLRMLTLVSALWQPWTVTAAEPLRILALGDSLTAGYGLRPSDGFTSQLERSLQARGISVVVLNAGVSGDTTSGGLARLEWALSDQPDAVILALGANDSLRAIDPALTRSNLNAILKRLTSQRLPVLLVGTYAPPNLGEAYATAFNAIYPELATQYQTLLYPFFLDGVAGRPTLNQDDGLHPTAEGVAIMVERITPWVLDLIERVQGIPPGSRPHLNTD